MCKNIEVESKQFKSAKEAKDQKPHKNQTDKKGPTNIKISTGTPLLRRFLLGRISN